jgi:hypothetical protein
VSFRTLLFIFARLNDNIPAHVVWKIHRKPVSRLPLADIYAESDCVDFSKKIYNQFDSQATICFLVLVSSVGCISLVQKLATMRNFNNSLEMFSLTATGTATLPIAS